MSSKQHPLRIEQVVLTSEHSGNKIPKEYQCIIPPSSWELTTHRGYDLGISRLFRIIKKRFRTHAFEHLISRLLVDVNRSIGTPSLFSHFTKDLSVDEQERILSLYYHKHRDSVQRCLKECIQDEKALTLHMALHSFTPVLRGKRRETGIGILFDPRRKEELEYSKRLKRHLEDLFPRTNVQFNLPYKGTDDGFPTYLREVFPKRYIGIELEVNQRLCKQYGVGEKISEALTRSISG